MVAPHHSSSPSRPGAAILKLGRLAWVLAIFACAGPGVLGCQQRARFANGIDGPSDIVYHRHAPERESEPVALVPPPPIAEIAPAPAISGNFPASWSPPARNRPWRWIVIHHSATFEGGAARFDKQHRDNGWDELGYHFVIGNGSDTRDGQIEVGPRWTKQKHGAHAKTPDNRFNDYGIGICLVGNFDSSRPTEQQLRALATVVAYLMQKYDIPASRVIGHDDTGRSTACPGRNLEAQLPGVRRVAARAVANGFAADQRLQAQFASESR